MRPWVCPVAKIGDRPQLPPSNIYCSITKRGLSPIFPNTVMSLRLAQSVCDQFFLVCSELFRDPACGLFDHGDVSISVRGKKSLHLAVCDQFFLVCSELFRDPACGLFDHGDVSISVRGKKSLHLDRRMDRGGGSMPPQPRRCSAPPHGTRAGESVPDPV